MLEIRRVDPGDTAAVETWLRLYREAWRAFDPTAELASDAECRGFLRPGPHATHALEGYIASDGPLPVGAATLQLRLADNRDRATAFVQVPPEHAGAGVGGELLQHLEDRTRTLGKRHLDGEPREDNTRAMALARRFGFRHVLTEVERRLPLPLPPERIARLAAECEPRVAPYAVRVIVGPLPEELLPSYAAVKNRMNLDAPTGDMALEVGGRTPENLRAQDRRLAAAGSERITGIALAPDGTVVGAAELVVDRDAPGIAQWGTIVAPAARGHRLGLAMKLAAAGVAQERHPERRYIVTDNAESNRYMVAINEALGFEIYARYAQLTKDL